MSAKSKGFLLYPNQWPALSRLSDKQLGQLLAAIFDYIREKTDVETIENRLDSETAIAFRFLQLQLDIDEEKYQQLIEKRRAAAQRRWAKYANDANNANASFAMLEEEGEKEGEKEGEAEGEAEGEKEGEGEAEADGEKEDDDAAAAALNNNNAREARKASAAAQQDIFLRFKKEAPKTILPWINEILDDAGSKIPRLKYMTQKRIERLFALVQQYGNAAIGEALRKAARSPFLNGRGKRNQFVADIDWVLSEQHFLEVLEGKYNTEIG